MRWFNFSCLMLGHDDRIRRVQGRMYMECAECGRETKGWLLKGDAALDESPSASRRSADWRSLWSQALRDRLQAFDWR